MKRFSLFMAVAAIVLTGCSTDNDLEFNEKNKTSGVVLKSVNVPGVETEALSEIIAEYIIRHGNSEKDVEIVLGRVVNIAKSNLKFLSLEGVEYLDPDKDQLDDALEDPELLAGQIYFSSETTENIDDFFNQHITDDTDIDVLIASFKDEIQNSAAIASEKEIVLKSASLMSQSRYLAPVGADKDKDWSDTRSVCASSLSGGTESPAQAVFNAAVITALTL